MTKGRGTALHRLRRWCFLFILGFKRLTGYHCLAFLALFMIGTVIATIANDHPEAGWISTIRPAEVTLVHDVPDLDDNFQPLDEVAWAIPVGGRTKRSAGLDKMLQTLLSGGVRKTNLIVFEDDFSRPDGHSDPDVAAVAAKHGVQVIPSRIPRIQQETAVDYGIHLARHYHFMLDAVFLGHGKPEEADANPDQRLERTFGYVVILEDDLLLAPDIVKYFHEMSRVMQVDDTLFCAAAHQDNAFPATCLDAPSGEVMKAEQFDFRRGNHFMAPGWMTSAKVYKEIVRPVWLDAQGNYLFKEKFRLKNGHWDRFWDTRIDKKECIFPEVPRIAHQGADGFTVSKQGQVELYDNLVLSQRASDADYGDILRLTNGGYENTVQRFLKDALTVVSLDDIARFRKTKLKLIIDASNDQDPVWNRVMVGHFGLIGVGGYGGNPMYAKLRGVHKGSVFVRWLTNLVLVVGSYSPYVRLFAEGPVEQTPEMKLTYEGCFMDGLQRDLAHLMLWHSPDSVMSPTKCVSGCRRAGYKFAGLQMGEECWCGNTYNRHGRAPDEECDKRCGGGGRKQSFACGGSFRNSIYWSSEPLPKASANEAQNASVVSEDHESWRRADQRAVEATAAADTDEAREAREQAAEDAADAETGRLNLDCVQALYAPPDAVFVAGKVGESCAAACERATRLWGDRPGRIPRAKTAVAVTHWAGAQTAAARGGRGPANGVAPAGPPDLSQLPSTSVLSSKSKRLFKGGVAASTRTQLVCNEQLFGLLHAQCETLQELLGCTRCMGVSSADMGFVAPGKAIANQQCLMSAGKYLQCQAQPQGDFVRACVCEVRSGV